MMPPSSVVRFAGFTTPSSGVDWSPRTVMSNTAVASPAMTQRALIGQRESDVTFTNVTRTDSARAASPGASVTTAGSDGTSGLDPHAASRTTPAASARMRFMISMLLPFGDLGPRVLERHRPVEDGARGGRFRIDTEVAKPFELVACAGP